MFSLKAVPLFIKFTLTAVPLFIKFTLTAVPLSIKFTLTAVPLRGGHRISVRGGRDFLGTNLFSGIRNKIQEKRYKTHKV